MSPITTHIHHVDQRALLDDISASPNCHPLSTVSDAHEWMSRFHCKRNKNRKVCNLSRCESRLLHVYCAFQVIKPYGSLSPILEYTWTQTSAVLFWNVPVHFGKNSGGSPHKTGEFHFFPGPLQCNWPTLIEPAQLHQPQAAYLRT